MLLGTDNSGSLASGEWTVACKSKDLTYLYTLHGMKLDQQIKQVNLLTTYCLIKLSLVQN